MEKVLKYCVALGSAYLAILYPSRLIFGVLIIVNIIDYITGILRAVSAGEMVCPEKSFKGIVSKINKLFYVAVALSIDMMIIYAFQPDKPSTAVSAAVISWLVINELVSICSNISNNSSANVPPAILKFLEKFKEGE